MDPTGVQLRRRAAEVNGTIWRDRMARAPAAAAIGAVDDEAAEAEALATLCESAARRRRKACPRDHLNSQRRSSMTVNFAPGDLVRARGREWVALPSPREGDPRAPAAFRERERRRRPRSFPRDARR